VKTVSLGNSGNERASDCAHYNNRRQPASQHSAPTGDVDVCWTTKCQLSPHSTTPTPTRPTLPTSLRPTRAVSRSYSCSKLNDTLTRRSSRGCRRGCRCRHRGIRALLRCAIKLSLERRVTLTRNYVIALIQYNAAIKCITISCMYTIT